jgi:hypothetical protein
MNDIIHDKCRYVRLLECALTLARDLAYIWPRCPHPILPVCNSSITGVRDASTNKELTDTQAELLTLFQRFVYLVISDVIINTQIRIKVCGKPAYRNLRKNLIINLPSSVPRYASYVIKPLKLLDF